MNKRGAVADQFSPFSHSELTLDSLVELEHRYGAENYDPLPVVLSRGLGAELWDISGKRYIDMMSAYSAVSHGHSHPRSSFSEHLNAAGATLIDLFSSFLQ